MNSSKNSINNQSEITVPESFKPFGVALPPMFLAMAGYTGGARFVGINYFGSKATWHDGRGSATFSYFSVYAPFIHHPAIAFVLKGADLGSDDSDPNATIIFDTQDNKLFLASYSQANRFLSEQHPPVEPVVMTDEEWRELNEKISSQSKDIAAMQRSGMFEMFAPAEDRRLETEALINWLNENTATEVREHFAAFGVNI